MQAMIDTCIVIDFENYAEHLPDEIGVSAVVIAELSAGVAVVSPGPDRERRLARLQWARTFFEPRPLTDTETTYYGRMVAALRQAGRSERARVADLMIAATAATQGLPLYTNNADDFVGLNQLVDIVIL